MVNIAETHIIEKYEQGGWRTLRGGAPDFIFLKTNDGEITDFIFVEVKANDDQLTYEQAIYRKILEKLGAKYRIETTQIDPSHSKPYQATPCHPSPFHTVPAHPGPSLPNPHQTNPSHPISAQSIPSQKEVRIDGIEP